MWSHGRVIFPIHKNIPRLVARPIGYWYLHNICPPTVHPLGINITIKPLHSIPIIDDKPKVKVKVGSRQPTANSSQQLSTICTSWPVWMPSHTNPSPVVPSPTKPYLHPFKRIPHGLWLSVPCLGSKSTLGAHQTLNSWHIDKKINKLLTN